MRALGECLLQNCVKECCVELFRGFRHNVDHEMPSIVSNVNMCECEVTYQQARTNADIAKTPNNAYILK
jgi:hypothetical protein